MVGCKVHGTAKNPFNAYQQKHNRAASFYRLFASNRLGQFDALVIGRIHRVGGLLERDQEGVVVSCLYVQAPSNLYSAKNLSKETVFVLERHGGAAHSL